MLDLDVDPDEGQIVSVPGDELMLDEEENKDDGQIFSFEVNSGIMQPA